MTIRQIAQIANLTDESNMREALELIKDKANPSQLLYLSCVDLEDPSQMYDALIHFGAMRVTPAAFALGSDYHAYGEE